MTSGEIFVVSIIVAVALILFGLVTDKKAFLVRLVFRSVTGIFAIYLVNAALAYVHISLNLGVNVYTVGTASLLGIPGITLLYGILGCRLL